MGTKEIAVSTQDKGTIVMGYGTADGFVLLQRVANMLVQSSLVPKEYQGNLPNCMIALNMANRMNADPLMVMQNLYIVHGKPGWSSQFLISTFNACGRFSSIRYDWVGEKGKDSWGCKAWAIEKATGERLEGAPVTIEIAKKEGWYSKKDKNGIEISKWQTMPAQMLMYRSAAWFIRAYAPEISMGLHTQDEIIDIGDNEYEFIDRPDPEKEIEQNANTVSIDIEVEEDNEQQPEKAKDNVEPIKQKLSGPGY